MLTQVIGPAFGVSAVEGAAIGLCVLLATGVLTWQDLLGHKPAWDTFVWFSVLIGLSSQVQRLHVPPLPLMNSTE